MPALLAVSGIEALNMLDKEGAELMERLNSNIRAFRLGFTRNLTGVVMDAQEDSPLIHLRFKRMSLNRAEDEFALQQVVDQALKEGVLVTRAKYVLGQEKNPPAPSIRICLSAGFTVRDVDRAASVLREAFRNVLKLRK